MNFSSALFNASSSSADISNDDQLLLYPTASGEGDDDDQFEEIDEAELQTRRTVKLAFCIGYAILFLLGTLGNGLVIVMICNVLSTLRRNGLKCGSSRKLLAQASAQHVFIYVLGLSIVDLFVILHLPLLIFEMREGQWIFGEFMCKLYWFGESVNKLLSSFLMTVLSWDRYMAVCFPIRSIRMRTNSVAISVLASCTFFATLLLYPVLKESTVLRVNKLTGLRLLDDDEAAVDAAAEQVLLSASEDESASVNIAAAVEQQPIVLKCVFDTSSPVFMLYTFGVGYLVPALLITFFYAQVILKLRRDALAVRKHSDGQNPSISSARLHKVTKRIVAVILFYFFCWTPYWTLNIMSQFGVIIVSWSTLTLSSVFFAAHLLVCFNSAANPVLYALINRELRQQHAQAFQKRRRSLHMVTNNALGFIDKKLPSPTNKLLMKEHRLASVGCTEDTQLRLLGNGMSANKGGGRLSVENGLLFEKRSNSFSHSSPTLQSFSSRLSHLRLFGKRFGSSQLLVAQQQQQQAEMRRNSGGAIETESDARGKLELEGHGHLMDSQQQHQQHQHQNGGIGAAVIEEHQQQQEQQQEQKPELLPPTSNSCTTNVVEAEDAYL